MAEFVVATSVLLTRVDHISAKSASELKQELVKRTTMPSGEWKLDEFAVDSANVQIAEVISVVPVPVERRA